MRLRSLELNNFRGFQNANARIDLDHDAVLLYGRNGVGKTALFDAVELALTGSLRRVDFLPDISSVLVNARHDTEAATIRIEIDHAGRKEQQSTFRVGHGLEVKPLLGIEDIAIFRHTAYLQQSDIRRLISADSVTLGEVIRSLAVSGEIERLDRALADANLTRLNPVYKTVSKVFEEKRASIEQLRLQISADERAISDIEGVEATITKAVETLRSVELILKVDQSGTDQKADDVLKAISRADGILQSRLTDAVGRRAQAESRLKRAEQLSREHEAIKMAQAPAGATDRIGEVQIELKSIENEIQSYLKDLAQPEYAAISKQQQSRIIALLEAARAFSGAGICPICDQQLPDLMSHIEMKLTRLQQSQSRTQAAYSDCQRKLSAAEEKRVCLNTEVDKSAQASKELSTRQLDFQKAMAEFSSTYKAREISLTEAISLETTARETAERETLELTSLATQLSTLRSEISSASIRSARIRESLELSKKKLEAALASIKSA